MTKQIIRPLLLVVLTGGLALSAFVKQANGQVLYGSMVGTVTDQTGAVVPGAQVTVTNEQTGLTRTSKTSSSGTYQVLNIPPGLYRLNVSVQGFKALARTGIAISIGQSDQQDVQLSVGAVSQQVTVTAGAAQLQTQTAKVQTTITSQAIENLPLDVYNNFQTTELLAPGVMSVSNIENNYPNTIGSAPDRSLAINSNGLPQHMNMTRVDGASNQYIWLADHILIVPPAQTVQEVNINTATFGVQTGLTAGADTEVITKSGTNQLHGSVYGFHTDQSLNAKNYFALSKPENILNNDGFTLGGPVVKNKLFFFGGWDGTFQRIGTTSENLIPPVDMRNGNFSGYLGSPLFDANGNPITVCTTEGTTVQLRENMIFDPATGSQTDGTGRCVFSSGGQANIIPSSGLYSGASNFWKNLRAPNDEAQTFTANTPFNDIVNLSPPFHRYVYTSKVDYNISQRQLLWVKYMAQSTYYNDPLPYGLAGGPEGDGLNTSLSQIVTIGHTWTAGSNLVLNGHIGFTRMKMDLLPPSAEYGQPFGQSILQIANTNIPAGNKLYSGLPGISIQGFSGLGDNESWNPYTFRDWSLFLDEGASLIHGKHQISFGFEANHNHLNDWDPEIVCCQRGAISTAQYNTFLNLPADTSNPGGAQMATYAMQNGVLSTVGFSPGPWNSVAEFDMGMSSEVQKAEEFIQNNAKEWQTALYVGDTWRAKRDLTVDAGLRWEYYPFMTRDGAIKDELYDPTTNTLLLGGLGGNPPHLGMTSSKTNFAPRLGIAYQWHHNTVIRSAFGITYDTLPMVRPMRGAYPQSIGITDFVPSSSVSRFLPYNTWQQGVPIVQLPDISTGKLTPASNATLMSFAPGEFKRAYVESWNFTVERKLPKSILLTMGYVGNHLVHELNGANINAAPLGTGGAGQPLSQFGNFNSVYQYQGYLDSHYNSFQVSLQRQVSSGLFLQGSYTYSHAISYIDDEGWENGLTFNCTPSSLVPQGCQQLNRGAPFFDHTHQLNMAFIYQLPFGKGQRWIPNKGVARSLLGGWQANGVITAFSGAPLTITQDGSFLNTPGTTATPDFVGPLNMTKGIGPGSFWFNTNAFQPLETAQLGTSGRGLSWLRGPGVAQLDFSLFRNFKLTERFNLQFRAETLNLTNTPHFYNPATNCAIVSGVCGGSFGQATSAFGQRILQLGAKLSF
jgi:hypothetical protein